MLWEKLSFHFIATWLCVDIVVISKLFLSPYILDMVYDIMVHLEMPWGVRGHGYTHNARMCCVVMDKYTLVQNGDRRDMLLIHILRTSGCIAAAARVLMVFCWWFLVLLLCIWASHPVLIFGILNFDSYIQVCSTIYPSNQSSFHPSILTYLNRYRIANSHKKHTHIRTYNKLVCLSLKIISCSRQNVPVLPLIPWNEVNDRKMKHHSCRCKWIRLYKCVCVCTFLKFEKGNLNIFILFFNVILVVLCETLSIFVRYSIYDCYKKILCQQCLKRSTVFTLNGLNSRYIADHFSNVTATTHKPWLIFRQCNNYKTTPIEVSLSTILDSLTSFFLPRPFWELIC